MQHQYTNALINETSPYLLQHAHNPVNWHAWNTEVLKQAQTADKLLLISVGYSACHWCHVMEHESFEDSAVAEIMNAHFINIKVDREERPDVDQIYMDACQLITGQGGWPLNVIALPDGRPIYAGTYFPKAKWMEVLNFFADYYPDKKEEAEKQAALLQEGLLEIENIPNVTEQLPFSVDDLHAGWNTWKANIDFKNGGRNGAPKFMMPNNWQYLLRYYYYTENEQTKQAIITTLNKMAAGGLYDQVGGGFARYSTDSAWKIPHFEKMLYDNAQLVSLYSEAYALTKNQFYKETVYETLAWVEREMQSTENGFYSALDADSEGEEGKFYVWKETEIDSILGNEAHAFKTFYNITQNGNWEHGNNILHSPITVAQYAAANNIDAQAFSNYLKACETKLLAYRKTRIRPGLDDKILTAWNALMLKGYTDAFKAFNDDGFKAQALANAQFIVANVMDENGRLNRNFKNGKSTINAFLDDYAFTIEAFIALYEITFDELWLKHAQTLTEYVILHFYNKENDLFYYTSNIDEKLVVRKHETTDNVIPASNSSMAKSLFLLGTYFDNTNYKLMSKTMVTTFMPLIRKHTAFYSNWAWALTQFVYPPYEVAIVGENYDEKRAELQAKFIPNAIYLGGKTEGNLALLQSKLVQGATFIYVCKNKVCKLPVETTNEAIKLLTKP